MSDNHASHHIIQPKVYALNAVVILILMFATVGAAKFVDIPGGANGPNFWIAITIAVMKMGFIMAYFMGVRYSTPLVKIMATAAFLWVLVFLAFTMSDYVSPHADLGSPYSDFANFGEYPLPK
ncbi:MAG: oxidase [Candidatus Hydrogenedentota bacterium]|nr:MAG: oxidase [Candidatus Hydrogenedentota bacterium]